MIALVRKVVDTVVREHALARLEAPGRVEVVLRYNSQRKPPPVSFLNNRLSLRVVRRF